MKIRHLEIILPVYNEQDCLPQLFERLEAVKKKLEGEVLISLLVVNDGSTDNTRALLESYQALHPSTRLFHLLHNFGHGPAITCGINQFQGDLAIVMDADLQDAPEVIPELYESWKNGARTAVAERGDRKEKHSFLFHAFYHILHWVSPHLPEIKFGTFCLLDASVVHRIRQLPEKNRYFPGLVSISSGKIESVLVHRDKRAFGTSRVGLLGLFNLATTALISFSNAPLRLSSFLGLFTSSVALFFGVIILSIKLFTELAIPGWASTMSVLFFGTGIQLLCLGIMGEYVARIYDEVKGRPLYFLEDDKEASQAFEKPPMASQEPPSSLRAAT